jgi:hypothetical protein
VADRGKGTGPKGGTSTVYKSGLLRKTAYFYEDEWEAIRKAAFDRDVSYTDVIREAVRVYLNIPD